MAANISEVCQCSASFSVEGTGFDNPDSLTRFMYEWRQQHALICASASVPEPEKKTRSSKAE